MFLLGSKLVDAAASKDLQQLQTLVTDLESTKTCLRPYLDTISGWSALHWAAMNNDAAMAEYLLSKGANPNLRNQYCPIHLTKDLSTLKTLLKYGATQTTWVELTEKGKITRELEILTYPLGVVSELGWDLKREAFTILKEMSFEWKQALVTQIKQQDTITIEAFKDRHYFHMSRDDHPIFEFMLDNLGYFNTAKPSLQAEYPKTKVQIAHLGLSLLNLLASEQNNPDSRLFQFPLDVMVIIVTFMLPSCFEDPTIFPPFRPVKMHYQKLWKQGENWLSFTNFQTRTISWEALPQNNFLQQRQLLETNLSFVT